MNLTRLNKSYNNARLKATVYNRFIDGALEWSLMGKLHSLGGKPAVICVNGTSKWYNHGKRHRNDDLPAVIYSDSFCIWYQHGNLQRHR